ncbi:hypothetical protein K469DRAFT_725504 [Zopfia rhizophila CBS 207.26]|uniref:Uncharacterized protein n=1 Tax=Zopfia rhizophila CBS 207.26 TaxID=1314779 RepID=A0A6A6E7R6_9PEZI|nr:hypothetical protein K469DRAFT_725504 [Zopfia rhizophila CBS 207.26]
MDNNGSKPARPAGVRDDGSQGRGSSAETEKTPSGQHSKEAGYGGFLDANEDEIEDESDPAEKIQDFDWKHLEERYHDAIKGCEGIENGLMQEWSNLMDFFRVWAVSGHEHETDRTYKRLRTRMAHVQHSENHLEKTRKHYINVVNAFESALQLLNSPSG